MDPKMDSGCVSAEELVDNDNQITHPLLPAEVIGIIDQLICLEVRVNRLPLAEELSSF